MDFEALRSDFQRDGVVKLTQFFTPEELAHCRRCFDEALNTPERKLQHTAYADGTVYNPASGYRGPNGSFRVLLDQTPQIAKTVQAAWGTSKNVWYYDHEIFNKAYEPGSEWTNGLVRSSNRSDTPFHQDTRVVAFAGEHLANLWIPFADLPAKNALQCVRGSHRGPLYNAEGYNFSKAMKDNEKTSKLDYIPEKVEDYSPEDIASWDLKEGDAILLHSGTVHGGGPVDENVPVRNALVLRMFGDCCFFTKEIGIFSVGRMYRGVQHGDHFSRVPGTMHILGSENPEEDWRAVAPPGADFLDSETGKPWWAVKEATGGGQAGMAKL